MTTATLPLHRDARGRLRCITADAGDIAVTVTAAFPLSDPGRWLSLRTDDGRELLLIEDPSDLPAEQRRLLDEELQTRHFTPVIRRVDRAANTTTGLMVDVLTDRGPTTLVLDADEHIRRVSDVRVVLTDRTGVRYLIPDLRQLDVQSRHRLERFH